MGEVATRAVEFFAVTVGLSAMAVVLFGRLAPAMGIVDKPGGRKLHASPVPLVGGLAIFAATLAGATLLGLTPKAGYFLLALSIIIAIGLWDDVTEVPPRAKIAMQAIACALMIWGAGVQLHTLGRLFTSNSVGLWIFAVPLTIFAVVGVVNAVNMMDGMDGLGGCIAFTASAWYGVVAIDSALDVQFAMALILCGAIAGFLIFNLRFPWQPRARVFMGDAGSLMIGFALGWFAIDLTQGPGRSFPPICALWVLLLPLADCVSLMLRRVAQRRSPFVGDRYHIHHYLLARGFSHSQTLAILTSLSVAFGAVGYFGWRLRVPDAVLFWTFVAGFFAYNAWIHRAWRRLDALQEAQGGHVLVETEQEANRLAMTRSILFVCKANLCRSPSAAAVLRAMLRKHGAGAGIVIESAGTHRFEPGAPPEAMATQAARRRGYDISSCRSRGVTPADFDRFDMILAVDRANLADLRRIAPTRCKHKVELLLGYGERYHGKDVPDPVGGDAKRFDLALEMIEDGCAGLAQLLVRAA